MNVDLTPVEQGFEPIWKQVKLLFVEHHFMTIMCGFFAVLMTISFYRFLKGISPALVYFVLAMILAVLVLHWTQTRTEPAFLTPFIDTLAPFFPSAPGPVGPPPKVYP